jgi:hypothetical protein
MDVVTAYIPDREELGNLSYWEHIAEHHPDLYTALIAKILPHQLQSLPPPDVDDEPLQTVEEINAAFRAEGLPPLKNVLQLQPRIEQKRRD